MSARLLLLALLAFGLRADRADTATYAKGSPVVYDLPVAVCNNTTAAAGPGWSLYATDPVATCPTTTAVKRGVLRYDDTNDCISTSATIGCAFYSFLLPAEFPAAGRIDARIVFASTDTTAGHTTIWTLATKCITPTVGANSSTGVTSDPSTTNASQSITYVTGAAEPSGSLRQVQQLGVTTTGCTGGDLLYVRIGRDHADTNTETSLDLAQVELTIYGNP